MEIRVAARVSNNFKVLLHPLHTLTSSVDYFFNWPKNNLNDWYIIYECIKEEIYSIFSAEINIFAVPLDSLVTV